MFVRKKHNASGVISIQIIKKENRKSVLVKTIGSSSKPEEIELLFEKGKRWIKDYKGELDLFNERLSELTHSPR